jgi:maltooligosyltrehalose trehalohydrolase
MGQSTTSRVAACNASSSTSAHLPPSAFVLFLQNHDQTGNRAFGERLRALVDDEALQAATLLVVLCPMVPLLFMGEEWGAREPFLYFTDHHNELADAVREGRRNEFKEFSLFSDSAQRERIPDPNDVSTFTHSIPRFDPERHPEQQTWRNFYRQLLALRREHIVPRIPGTRAEGARVLAEGALLACWQLGDGSRLRIDLNITDAPVRTEIPGSTGHMIHTQGIHMDDYRRGVLAPRSAAVSLERKL